jgi:hypothetical protein
MKNGRVCVPRKVCRNVEVNGVELRIAEHLRVRGWVYKSERRSERCGIAGRQGNDRPHSALHRQNVEVNGVGLRRCDRREVETSKRMVCGTSVWLASTE